MKFIRLFLFLPILAACLALTACLDDIDTQGEYYEVDMGTILKADRQYSLALDNAGTYVLADSSLLVAKALRTPGQRVVAMYRVDGGGRNGGGTLHLFDLTSVLTKAFSEKPLTQADSLKLGYDGIDVGSAWIAGGYLNVRFSYATDDALIATPHLISIFQTGETTPEGYEVVELRHNLNGHKAVNWRTGYASFTLPAYETQPKGFLVRYLTTTGHPSNIPTDF